MEFLERFTDKNHYSNNVMIKLPQLKIGVVGCFAKCIPSLSKENIHYGRFGNLNKDILYNCLRTIFIC